MRILLCGPDQQFNDAVSEVLTKLGHEVQERRGVSGTPEDLGPPGQTDALLLDLSPGAVDVAEYVALVRKGDPSLAIVVFTDDTDLAMIRRPIDHGADGVVLKREGADELERVLALVTSPWFKKLRASARPEKAWSPGARSLERYEWAHDLADSITGRERQVIEHLARGSNTAAIAAAMGLGESTVRSHLQSLFNKTGARSRVELVSVSVRAGIVRPEEAVG